MNIKRILPYVVMVGVGIGAGIIIAPYLVKAAPIPVKSIEWQPFIPGAGTAEIIGPDNFNKLTVHSPPNTYNATATGMNTLIYVD